MSKPNNNETTNRHRLSFAAVDPYLADNIIRPTEKKTNVAGKMVEWGTRNRYPQYLEELYENVATLHTIIDGDADFVAGDDVIVTSPKEYPHFQLNEMNSRGTTAQEQVREIAHDLDAFGGFALQVIRDRAGRVAELNHIPFPFLRTNEDNELFWYCEDWTAKGTKKAIVYQRYTEITQEDWAKLTDEQKAAKSSTILYVKRTHVKTYPSPIYAAAVKACEIERCADEYHLNAINNNFEGSVLINFNNGETDDDIKQEIEDDINEKFTGYQNAARVVISWNPSKDGETTITPIEVKDFGERYKALAEHSRQQIYCAFRAVPSLFGLPTASGFSTEEYEQAFKLYNRTRIRPMQGIITDAYAKVLPFGSSVTIVPFSLEGKAEENIN